MFEFDNGLICLVLTATQWAVTLRAVYSLPALSRDRLIKPSGSGIVLLSTPAPVILHNDAAPQSVAIH